MDRLKEAADRISRVFRTSRRQTIFREQLSRDIVHERTIYRHHARISWRSFAATKTPFPGVLKDPFLRSGRFYATRALNV
jgi:hypothetical protein